MIPQAIAVLIASAFAITAYKWMGRNDPTPHERKVAGYRAGHHRRRRISQYVPHSADTSHPTAAERLRALPKLENEYFAIRHGESEANVALLVSSHPVLSRTRHGLTDKGRIDAANGAKQILEKCKEKKETIVIHSPFLRTTQTAEIVAKILDADAMVSEDLLRERYFGDFENKNSHESYKTVWACDAIDGCASNQFNCESVYSASERAAQVILKCEKLAPEGGCRFVFVSHGDILQILRITLDRKADQKFHRNGEHINPGQAIPLQLV